MKQELINLFNKYQGTITTTDNSIKIVSNNLLGTKKEPCEISVEYENNIYRLHYEEKSYEILGGGAMPLSSVSEVVNNLLKIFKDYNFKEKQEPIAYDLFGNAVYK